MRIAVTGLRGIPNVMGGIETHCEELYPRMLRQDPALSVRCFARRPYMSSDAEFEFAGVRVKPLPSTRMVSAEAFVNTFLAVLYAGLVKRPDILHIHAIGPALMTPLAKLLGLKVVVTHHGRDYRRAKWGRFAKAVLRAGEVLALRFADATIPVSKSLADELRADFPNAADRVVFIPNGVSVIAASAPAAEDPLAALGLEPGGYMLSVGRLVPEKGFEDLIAAHAASGGHLKLVIAGGADHESDFARGLREMASDRVIFTGMLQRAQLAPLYRGAALFVLASHHEGLPIAALEAASCGTPLLLSDIRANLDIGLSSQNYFSVGDRTNLTACLAEAPETYAIEAENIRRRFDWSEVASSTASVYRSVQRGEAPRLALT